jgi:membrane protein required for colicin V production
MGNYNVVDIFILIIFFSSALIGFSRGLVGEIVSLMTLIAAFIVAIMFANPLATAFTTSSSVQSAVSQTSSAIGVSTSTPVSYLALGLSFGLLFAGTVIVGAVLKSILNIAFNTGILGFGNRVLGAGFGLIRGYLINVVLIFLIQLSPLSNQNVWHQSTLVPEFQGSVTWLANIVSPALSNLKSKFGSTLQNAASSIQNLTQ